MNLSLRIARRYLFAKKSTNAINIITGIAIFGIAVGAAALILVLSVFNGFEDLFLSLYDDFNPDVRITPARGKTFEADTLMLSSLQQTPGVQFVSSTLEEVAFFEYRDKQGFGRLKGVDESYLLVNNIDQTIREGAFRLQAGAKAQAIVGISMTNKLGIDVLDEFSSLSVYMPKRNTRPLDPKPFNTRFVYPSATFQVQQDMDNQYVLTSIEVARDLLELPAASVSALELKLQPDYTASGVIRDLRKRLGEDFVIQDRYEQEASFLRLMRVEKWISFAIVSLMMLLISFNIIGALWMIVLEKSRDISTLKSLGMTDRQVRLIFIRVGLLLCGIGLSIGFLLSAFIYTLQKTVGLITLPGGMLIDAYPVSLRWYDFPIVAVLVLVIGYLASVLPARRAERIEAIVREE